MKISTWIIILVLGFLIGTTIGEILRLVLPEKFLNAAVFKNYWTTGFSNLYIDAKIMSVRFSIKILITAFSWIGLFFSALVLLLKETFNK
ncbi:MAG: hypothetical protein NC906_00760 [Candidatus Omnitrophica bacterium]|nr:hypothetical protein [Candidatus Omnitrophota bacterium]MCM8817124.1 hypothetical protein [Candidatus Omnitrophota bacterium]